MNLNHLRYFLETSRNENITQTARQHLLPASSVSAAIKSLEQELGVALFDRSSNKIALTPQGRYYAAQVGSVFQTLEQAARQISLPESEAPRIKLLVRARSHWITELMVEYIAREKTNNFIISKNLTSRPLEEYDIIIDEPRPQYSAWDRFVLSVERICVKAAANSPLVGQALSFRQLAGMPFVLPGPGSGMRLRYEEACRRHRVEPQVIVECSDRLCLHQYVTAGIGLTLGSHRSLADDSQSGMTDLQVLDFDELQTVCVFYRRNPDSYHLKHFCDYLYSKRIL